MLATKNIFFLCLFASLSVFGSEAATEIAACTGGKCSATTPAPAVTKEACLNDPNCLCWCSQLCNWRKKGPNDHPVYIENDPYGKYCYCKQWDFDHYEDNCIYGRNVKQPSGAK